PLGGAPLPGGGGGKGGGRGGGAVGRAALAALETDNQTRYLVWWTAGDDRVRQRHLHNHAVMHGKVFAIDHSIWNTWWPPAGYNCRCFIGTISAAEARDLGYTGAEPTGPW